MSKKKKALKKAGKAGANFARAIGLALDYLYVEVPYEPPYGPDRYFVVSRETWKELTRIVDEDEIGPYVKVVK